MNNTFIWKCAFASLIRTWDIKMEGQYKLDNTVFFYWRVLLSFSSLPLSFKRFFVNSFRVQPFFSLNSCSLNVVTLNPITFLQLSLDFSELCILYCNAVKSQSAALQSFSISNDWVFVSCVICRALCAWDKV